METENNHSRPWEKVPQSVLNLLDVHSLVAFWDRVEQFQEAWRVMRASDVKDWQRALQVNSAFPPNTWVHNGAPLEDWIAAVEWLLK